jgi:hypothetical protein
MKSRITWKETLIILSVLILLVGTFRFAMGDIVFPHIFQSGAPAVAQEVNDNFAAINTRQAATFASMAGTFRCSGFYAQKLQGEETCILTISGSVTLMSDGTAFFSGTVNSFCHGTGNPVSFTGTYTINENGSGTLNFIDMPIMYFQASKDLNTVVLDLGNVRGNEYVNMSGTAVRL